MPLTREDVAGIADYARIALTPEELDEMTASRASSPRSTPSATSPT